MKKLCLTGGAGFIGSHCVEGILKLTDWNIVILDRLDISGNLERLRDIDVWEQEKHRVKFVWWDLKSPINSYVKKELGDINYIWHLAASSHVDRSIEDPLSFVMDNVVGTCNLLNYAREIKIDKFIYFSTDEVFGPAPDNVNYKEGDSYNPSNPYSASKEGGEAISKSFAFTYGLPIIITRTMNVTGERQHPEKFIPKTIKKILNNEKITIHGLPDNISSRKWIHARNVLDALLFLTEKGEIIEKQYQNDPSHGIYHIVGEERNVLELANKISKTIKNRELKESEIEYIDFHKTRPGHDLRYSLDGSKLQKMGFEYKLNLEQSFDKLIQWMISPENRKWLN